MGAPAGLHAGRRRQLAVAADCNLRRNNRCASRASQTGGIGKLSPDRLIVTKATMTKHFLMIDSTYLSPGQNEQLGQHLALVGFQRSFCAANDSTFVLPPHVYCVEGELSPADLCARVESVFRSLEIRCEERLKSKSAANDPSY